jgi:hypothetical protein
VLRSYVGDSDQSYVEETASFEHLCKFHSSAEAAVANDSGDAGPIYRVTRDPQAFSEWGRASVCERHGWEYASRHPWPASRVLRPAKA